MSVKVLKKKDRDKKEFFKEAASVDDAYAKGYFSGGLPFDEFCERILKPNPELRIHRNSGYTGLFDTENNFFVCGISRFSRIPRFTILKKDPSKDKEINYTDEDGKFTSNQRFNTDDEQGKVLARSWISVFNILRRNGYEVLDKDIAY